MGWLKTTSQTTVELKFEDTLGNLGDAKDLNLYLEQIAVETNRESAVEMTGLFSHGSETGSLTHLQRDQKTHVPFAVCWVNFRKM